MTSPIQFCLVLHNHQPVGNFDGVFEQAYQDSYLPFLDVFEPYADLKISLHTSGPLMEWLDQRHPEYVDRLAALAAEGRVEIVGGAFYEPILTMLPAQDRIGQIRSYSEWLENRLGADVQGAWIAERVWEQNLASDIAKAGIQYTVLDDYHFRQAGLEVEQLDGCYVTEDAGRTLSVFPGSERLRYLIPFAAPHETIDYLRGVAERRPGAVMVFGDDGEKFGTWPGTKAHVYENGWLRQFLDLLCENQDWLHTSRLSDAISQPPVGKVYLPDCSYREMCEWSLPVARQKELAALTREFEHDGRWPRIQNFLRGGFWRNFKVKYPEAGEMYARMMMVSRRLEGAASRQTPGNASLIQAATRELYRGQCNCSYWHGAFGGVYLPHLRNAVYNHLIAADNLLDQAENKPAHWVRANANDYNFDLRQEVLLSNDKLLCLIEPANGGRLYEFDVRSICHNLLATLSRREEVYHEKVLAGANQHQDDVASIHDRVVFKQEGLENCVRYDSVERKSLLDHFYALDANLENVRLGQAEELGDFVRGRYETRLRRNPDRIQVQLTRQGRVGEQAIKITKGVTLEAGGGGLEIAYLLEGLAENQPLHFAPEFNFAGLPAGADDRFFFHGDSLALGQLGSLLDLNECVDLGLADDWLGIKIRMEANRPTSFWTFPIETVSQSEGGFELVHQSVVVQPHWRCAGDAEGRWSVVLKLDIDTSLAESRRPIEAAATAKS